MGNLDGSNVFKNIIHISFTVYLEQTVMNPVTSAKQTVKSCLYTHLIVIVPYCWLVPRETRIDIHIKNLLQFHQGNCCVCISLPHTLPDTVENIRAANQRTCIWLCTCGENVCEHAHLCACVSNCSNVLSVGKKKKIHLFSCAVQSFTYGNKLD